MSFHVPARLAVLGSILTAVAAVGSVAAIYAVPTLVRTKPHLVIIVPGTYSNGDFWPIVIPDKVTFGSELEQALGTKGKVYPFLWASSIKHQNREEAAKNLAKYIDSQSHAHSKISLVGHSHGGNVALLAAGLCQAPIEKIVCLATPHAYLRTERPDGNRQAIPIYCSRRTLENSKSIISIVATSDAVPDVWSTDIFVGLRENEATALTAAWRDEFGQPRLVDDSLLSRLLQKGNISTTRELNVADHSLQLASQANDLFGTAAHSQIHSRRFGKLVGQLLREGDQAIESLARTVIPADADDGEPVTADVHAAWLKKHEVQFAHAGWLLRKASISLEDEARQSNDVDGSLPDPKLRICCGSTDKTYLETTESNSLSLECSLLTFVPNDSEWSLEVCDSDPPGAGFFGDRSAKLGSIQFSGAAVPPPFIAADPQRGILWSGKFVWQEAHY